MVIILRQKTHQVKSDLHQLWSVGLHWYVYQHYVHRALNKYKE